MLNCVFVANNFIAVNFIELWQPTHTHTLPDKFQLPEGQTDTGRSTVQVRDEVELRVEKLNSAQRVRRMFIIKLSLAEVVHSNLYEMLPTCHSIPGAQVYLKHLARNELTTCSTDSVAVVARSTSSPPCTVSQSCVESRPSPVPSATFMGISATYVVCCVQEHFSSAPSTSAPSDEVFMRATRCALSWNGSSRKRRGSRSRRKRRRPVIAPHLNF